MPRLTIFDDEEEFELLLLAFIDWLRLRAKSLHPPDPEELIIELILTGIRLGLEFTFPATLEFAREVFSLPSRELLLFLLLCLETFEAI